MALNECVSDAAAEVAGNKLLLQKSPLSTSPQFCLPA